MIAASRAAWSLMFEALAKSYGADDAKRIAELVMDEHGGKPVNEQTASEIIADIYIRVGFTEKETRVPDHDVLKVLLVTSGTLATAGNAYHVIAAHQMSEAECRWPVCKSVRENREEIHALVEKLKGEESAT